MTCIIGYKRKGLVYMAGDSQGLDEWYIRNQSKTKKVWSWGDGTIVFGGSGSYRAIQIIQQWLGSSDIDSRYEKYSHVSAECFIICHLVPIIKDLLEGHDFSEKKDEKSYQEAGFLVGYKGELFEIIKEYAAIQISGPFASIGCGYMIALGAMDTLVKNTRLNPETVLTRTLTTVVKFNAGVGEPFTIVRTK